MLLLLYTCQLSSIMSMCLLPLSLHFLSYSVRFYNPIPRLQSVSLCRFPFPHFLFKYISLSFLCMCARLLHVDYLHLLLQTFLSLRKTPLQKKMSIHDQSIGYLYSIYLFLPTAIIKDDIV